MADNKLTQDNSSNGFNSKQNPSVDKNSPRMQEAKAAQAKFEKERNACYTTNVQYTRAKGAKGIPLKRG